MKLKKYLLPSVAVLGGLALISRQLTRAVAAPAAVKAAVSPARLDMVVDYIEEQVHRLNIPGASLAIVEGDQVALLRGFGCARPGGEAPSPQTPFFIGSLTKSITALAVMQLVEADKVELDAPVRRYLPWFRVADPAADRSATAHITVRHLLNHTSGLSVVPGLANLADCDDLPGTAERQIRALATEKLNRSPGAAFEYSNTNYNLLGLVVEAASGESFGDYIQSLIFDPLDMRHTYISKEAAQHDGLAMGHRYWFGMPVPAPDLPVPYGSLASGQIISTAEDMAHYLIANLNGGRYEAARILSLAGTDTLHRGAAPIVEMGTSFGAYGMGWISQGSGEARIVSHSGIVPDFGAVMALVPEQNLGLVLLFNANHFMTKLTFDEMGLGAAQRLAGIPPAPPRFAALPWLMPGMLVIPLLQAAWVAGTLTQVRQWRRDRARRPSRGKLWRRFILLPLVLNLLPALALIPVQGRLGGFLRLFAPDFSWLARVCGSFALVWSFWRTGMLLRAHKEDRDDD